MAATQQLPRLLPLPNNNNNDDDAFFLTQQARKNAEFEAAVEQLNSATRSIQLVEDAMKVQFDPAASHALSEQLKDSVARGAEGLRRGKALLEALHSDLHTGARTRSSLQATSLKAQSARWTATLRKAFQSHHEAKTRARDASEERLVRRGQLLCPDLPVDTLRQRVCAHPSEFLREAILTEASEEARGAFADAQSRARDVEALVRSIEEMKGLFDDLATLIAAQSQGLDQIGFNVTRAGEHVRKGNGALRTSIELQRKTRARTCCMVCVLVVVVVVVLGVSLTVAGALTGFKQV